MAILCSLSIFFKEPEVTEEIELEELIPAPIPETEEIIPAEEGIDNLAVRLRRVVFFHIIPLHLSM